MYNLTNVQSGRKYNLFLSECEEVADQTVNGVVAKILEALSSNSLKHFYSYHHRLNHTGKYVGL